MVSVGDDVMMSTTNGIIVIVLATVVLLFSIELFPPKEKKYICSSCLRIPRPTIFSSAYIMGVAWAAEDFVCFFVLV